MSEHEQRGPGEADGEREPTIRDLDVPEDDAARVSGGDTPIEYVKIEMGFEVKRK